MVLTSSGGCFETINYSIGHQSTALRESWLRPSLSKALLLDLNSLMILTSSSGCFKTINDCVRHQSSTLRIAWLWPSLSKALLFDLNSLVILTSSSSCLKTINNGVRHQSSTLRISWFWPSLGSSLSSLFLIILFIFLYCLLSWLSVVILHLGIRHLICVVHLQRSGTINLTKKCENSNGFESTLHLY